MESLSTTLDALEVARHDLLNEGAQWTVTFPAANGSVASLYVDSSGLSGTGVAAIVSEEQPGSSLGGSFYLYSNGGSSAGFPIDAEGAYVGAEAGENNSTGRSEPLAWDAAAADVQAAIEDLLPSYVSSGARVTN